MNFEKILKSGVFTSMILLFTYSCVNQDFEEAQFKNEDPDLVVTTTIAELKSLHTVGKLPTVITEDLVIKGVCNSSDKSGNIFKQITIQDETGGILLRIDRADSFTEYPVGRNIFVKVKGLAIGDFNGIIQLGKLSGNGAGTDRIPDGLVDQHIFPGAVIPEPLLGFSLKTIDQLNENDQSTLIRLENVVFQEFAGLTYAVPVPPGGQGTTRDRILADCNGNTIVLRNSDYSDFASSPIPTGLVTITGIYSLDDEEKQFIIRDLEDVKIVSEDRCPGSGKVIFSENFDTGTDNTEFDFPKWTNFKEAGTQAWTEQVFQQNGYAEAKVFSSGVSNMRVWLITPQITLTTNNVLNFKTAVQFHDSDNLKVFISTDYDGSDVLLATWKPIVATLAGSGQGNNVFVESGNISLSEYNDRKIHIAFFYEGSDGGSKTTTYHVDDVSIKE